MQQTNLPKLTILLGAGSTISAGLPSTQEITKHLEHLDTSTFGGCGSPIQFFTVLKKYLTEAGKYKDPNFEVMLHALEELEPLLYVSSNSEMHDYYRPVLSAFIKGLDQHPVTSIGYLDNLRKFATFNIGSLIKQRVDESQTKGKELSELLLSLSERFTIRLFTLNYDDLVDRVNLPWCDGFDDCSKFPSDFNPKRFLEESAGSDPLLVHLHGSIRFGFEQGLALTIKKYNNPGLAITTYQAPGADRNIQGKLISSGPIISGLNKLNQLLFRPSPYGYYFKRLIDNLLNNRHLLILGYGGWDTHINEWILQSAALHKDTARIVWITKLPQATNDGDVADLNVMRRIANYGPRHAFLNNEPFQHHQKTLALISNGFPFEDAQTTQQVAEFLMADA